MIKQWEQKSGAEIPVPRDTATATHFDLNSVCLSYVGTPSSVTLFGESNVSVRFWY